MLDTHSFPERNERLTRANREWECTGLACKKKTRRILPGEYYYYLNQCERLCIHCTEAELGILVTDDGYIRDVHNTDHTHPRKPDPIDLQVDKRPVIWKCKKCGRAVRSEREFQRDPWGKVCPRCKKEVS